MCIELWDHKDERDLMDLVIGTGTRVARFTK